MALDASRTRRGSKYEDHSIPIESRTVANPAAPCMPKSLGEILANPSLRYKFRQFLKERQAVESLMFYESIELYEKIDDVKWRKRAAEGLMAKFVMSDAEFEVNISGACRERLLRTTKWDKECFGEVKYELYDLLKMNFFAAFIAKEFLMAS